VSPYASREQTNENGAGGWVDHGEKQRLMALAAGRMDGGGLEPSAGSDVSSCAKRMSNPGVEMPEGRFERPRVYTQRILSQLSSSIGHNSGHASPYLTAQKLLIQSRFTSSRFMVVDADNVDCCEKMSHECPKKTLFSCSLFELQRC
jgi:hypothetical protein